MPRFTRRELAALGGTTLLGAAVVVTAVAGQMRAAVSLVGVLLVVLAALVIRNNRALLRTRRALDWLSRPAPASPPAPADSQPAPADSLPETFEQMRADVESVLKGLQRDIESVRFGQTMVAQTTGQVARDVAALGERHDALETMIASLRGAGPSGAPATRDDLPEL